MERLRKNIDRYTAAPMFVATLLFLLCLAGIIHLDKQTQFQQVLATLQWGAVALYSLFVAELIVHVVLRTPRWKQYLVFCLLPPLRIGARDSATGETMWLPGVGWIEANNDLHERLARTFSVPMIVIALMVLPLIAVEHFWSERIAKNSVLALFTQTSTGFIWLAFTLEFSLMVSIVERKIRYCKEHWIDMAIILLPLIAFLRAFRLGRLLRIKQLARTARMYRMRGLLMKAYRSLLVLEVIDRLLRPKPAKRLVQLQEILEEKEQELEELRSEIKELEQIVEAEAKAEAEQTAVESTN